MHSTKRLSLVIAAVCLLSTNGRGDERANARRIEQMTALERTELERKFDLYRTMSESEREEMREVHDQLEQQPRLSAVMHRYHEWLQTLTPWQRDELRNEDDPAARIRLVRKFQQEREDRPSRGWLLPPDSGWDRSSNPQRRLWRFRLRLKDDDRQSVMRVVERNVVIREEDIRKLESLEGLSRHLYVLSIPLRPEIDRDDGDEAPPERPGSRLAWMNDRLLNDMLAAVSDESVRNTLAQSPLERRRQEMAQLVAKGLFSELRDELGRLETDETQLQTVLDNLEPDERKDLEKDLMHLSPRDQQRRLKWHYLRREKEELRYFWPVFRALVPRSRGDRDAHKDDSPRFDDGSRGRRSDSPNRRSSRDR